MEKEKFINNEKVKGIQKTLLPYWQSLIPIFQYQLITKILIALWLLVLKKFFLLLLQSKGRVSVTSGDFAFIFTSWQGILIILTGLLSLFVYIAFDLNAKLILSKRLLMGEPISIRRSIRESFASIRSFLNLRGIGIVLYITLIAPLLGFGMCISLTKDFYIPTFITSVIQTTPLYRLGYSAIMLVFLIVGVANMFILHGVVLEGMPVKEASRESERLVGKYWKDYLKQNILYAISLFAVMVCVVLFVLVIPLAIVYILPMSEGARRVFTILFVLTGSLLSSFAGLFVTPLYVMKVTQLYYTYRDESKMYYPVYPPKKHPVILSGIVLILMIVTAATFFMNRYFDDIFPLESTVGIIAHRGGGNEGPENTVAGLETAFEAGAYGSEIDIQRTKDGFYVLNHDNTFERVAGDSRSPAEMTLDEVRTLSVNKEPVPTFEEMLSACKGRMILFAELKGSTADKQMADDAVRIIKEYGMEEECVMISLKYDLIDYIERTYPEMQTGFLTFVSFGDTAALNCDYLALEEESATSDTIKSIHDQNKKVLVWTANEENSQHHFLCTDADGMITDNVIQAVNIRQNLSKRTDLDRIIDYLLGM